MSMADHEPASGCNLPAGCFEGDARFCPDDRVCDDCRWCAVDAMVCCRELFRSDVRDVGEMVDAVNRCAVSGEPCEFWEEYR